jgi:hypothetical protein
LLFGILAGAFSLRAEGDGIPIKDLNKIFLLKDGDKYNFNVARALRKFLMKYYNVDATIIEKAPTENQGGILLGRKLCVETGILTEKEIDAVKYEGYVIKVSGNRVAIAGYRSLGTLYGAYRFLEKIGIKLYPWHNGPDASVCVFTPPENGIIKPFSFSIKPFFDYVDLASHLDHGKFGCERDTGDPRKAANPELFNKKGDWMDWFHSASYLVPKGLYYDEHPEYFAFKRGKRIPKNIKHTRTALCLSNKDVHKISRERAVEWVGMQKENRFFGIHDGDTDMCKCAECIRIDYYPHYFSSRLLNWVNYVAKGIYEKYPDKLVLCGAYAETVKPPYKKIKLAPNVRILYAAWFWNSRTTSAQTFAHPYNITSMEEIMEWLMDYPGQIGLYEYPGNTEMFLKAQSKRLKFYAKNGIKDIYFNGRPSMFPELYHYVTAKLTEDPYLDSEKLKEEFCNAFYGPAAEPMLKYLELHSKSYASYPRRVFNNPQIIEKALQLFKEAEEKVKDSKLDVKVRVQKHILSWLKYYLIRLDPAKKPSLKLSAEKYGEALRWYSKLNDEYIANCKKLKLKYPVIRQERDYKKTLASIGLKKKTDKLEDLFDRAASTDTGQGEEQKRIEKKLKNDLNLDSCAWKLYSTIEKPVVQPAQCAYTNKINISHKGIKLCLPFLDLPVETLKNNSDGVNKMRAGRFFLESNMPEPLEAKGCRYIDIHLYSSVSLPTTIYFLPGKSRGQHSDVFLNAGEQIVRFDLDNFYRMDKSKWDRKIHKINFDFLPQDNFYPYPKVKNAEVIIFGISAKNYEPTPIDLPYKGKALWLTQFRPNIPFEIKVDKKYMACYGIKDKRHLRGIWYSSEKFRTFTKHRLVAPIFAIVSGDALEAPKATQKYLNKLFKIKLPINPPEFKAVTEDSSNAIFLGKKTALKTGTAKNKELVYAGEEGFVIQAKNGRLGISGNTERASLYGVARFLEEYGTRFWIPDINETIPNLENKFLHELYLIDKPVFKQRKIPGGWKLQCQLPAKKWGKKYPESNSDSLQALAQKIKDASKNKKPLAPELLKQAQASPAALYLSAKLMWDPFLDASQVIKGFRKGLEKK